MSNRLNLSDLTQSKRVVQPERHYSAPRLELDHNDLIIVKQ